MQPLADGYYWFMPKLGDPEIITIWGSGVRIRLPDGNFDYQVDDEGMRWRSILREGKFVGPLIPPEAT